jgi:hypothetical protein
MSVAGQLVIDIKVLADEWHATRNKGIDPSKVSAGSNKKVWWKCSRGHDFLKSPNGRTNNGRASGRIGGCPSCRSEDGGLDFWSWDRIVEIAEQIVSKEGFLPPAAYFRQHDRAMLVECLYQRGKTWADLREAVGSFQNSTFVESRSGLRWLSHAEASLSNFLYARGISHQKGRRYPKEYEALSGRRSGFYDLHFRSGTGEEIDVEIWGDKPHPSSAERYAATRELKERFNIGKRTFLGIHHLDCHSDEKLSSILSPYLTLSPPFVFTKHHDHIVESSHWSNADDLIETCRELAAQQPDGKLPSEGWLRKRGKFADRPGPAYNTIAVYIKTWLGGIRQARALIGQPENSTIKWSRETALEELTKWFDEHGRSPGAIKADMQRKGLKFDHGELKRGQNIVAAIEKHFGTLVDACLHLGISPSRRSPKR